MKALLITCSTCVAVALLVAPVALALPYPPKPSAVERLVRQEDARWNSPRLDIAQKPAPQPSTVERLVRQEDARAGDRRVDLRAGVAHPADSPAVPVLDSGTFDWLAVAMGALAGLALALVGAWLVMVARSHRPRSS